jgi:hypothetical protein
MIPVVQTSSLHTIRPARATFGMITTQQAVGPVVQASSLHTLNPRCARDRVVFVFRNARLSCKTRFCTSMGRATPCMPGVSCRITRMRWSRRSGTGGSVTSRIHGSPIRRVGLTRYCAEAGPCGSRSRSTISCGRIKTWSDSNTTLRPIRLTQVCAAAARSGNSVARLPAMNRAASAVLKAENLNPEALR